MVTGGFWDHETETRGLERDKKTLADLRISCKMKPILDLIQIRQLNDLASLAGLPDDRLEKLFSEVILFQSTQPV